MKSKVKAKLFSFEVFLNRDGNVELFTDAVDVKEFEKTMNMGLPMTINTIVFFKGRKISRQRDKPTSSSSS